MSNENSEVKEKAKKHSIKLNIIYTVLLVLLICVNVTLIIYLIKLALLRISEITTFLRNLGLHNIIKS